MKESRKKSGHWSGRQSKERIFNSLIREREREREWSFELCVETVSITVRWAEADNALCGSALCAWYFILDTSLVNSEHDQFFILSPHCVCASHFNNKKYFSFSIANLELHFLPLSSTYFPSLPPYLYLKAIPLKAPKTRPQLSFFWQDFTSIFLFVEGAPHRQSTPFLFYFLFRFQPSFTPTTFRSHNLELSFSLFLLLLSEEKK